MMILTEFMESGSLDNFLKVAVLIKLSSQPGPKLELRPWWPSTFHGLNRFPLLYFCTSKVRELEVIRPIFASL